MNQWTERKNEKIFTEKFIFYWMHLLLDDNPKIGLAYVNQAKSHHWRLDVSRLLFIASKIYEYNWSHELFKYRVKIMINLPSDSFMGN
jgi:hypothetical protein